MRLREFEAIAAERWERIPAELKEGVEALVIEEGELGHPALGGVYTLGEFVPEFWPSGFGGSGDVSSHLVLYYGSFRALAALDEAFDWEEEIWETILHELLHHRETAAGVSDLDELDWAIDQNFRRLADRPFDPTFYRSLAADVEGAVRLESEIFVEGAPEGPGTALFTWRGSTYSIRVPWSDVALFVRIRNLAAGRLTVVVQPRPSLVRRLLGSPAAGVKELARRALPLPAP